MIPLRRLKIFIGGIDDDIADEDVIGLQGDIASPEELPSLHEITQKRAIKSWKKIRPDLLRVAIETEALPENQHCVLCITEEASWRCLQCGPRVFFCVKCFEEAHSVTNIFHTGEIWEVCIKSFLCLYYRYVIGFYLYSTEWNVSAYTINKNNRRSGTYM